MKYYRPQNYFGKCERFIAAQAIMFFRSGWINSGCFGVKRQNGKEKSEKENNDALLQHVPKHTFTKNNLVCKNDIFYYYCSAHFVLSNFFQRKKFECFLFTTKRNPRSRLAFFEPEKKREREPDCIR